MFCSNCGKYIPEGASICPECGLNLAGVGQQTNQGGNEIIPSIPNIPDIPLAEPIPMENVLNQNTEPQKNTSGYSYQQNMNPNEGGGYGYSQNMYQNNANFSVQQPQVQNNGYYDGLNAGTPERSNWNAGAPGQPGSSGLSGGALACGICSIVFGFLGGFAYGIIGAGLGTVLGMVGLVLTINYRKSNGGSGATGGLVTSIIGLVISVILLAGCIACGYFGGEYLYLGCVGGSCKASKNINDFTTYSRYYD